MQVVDRFSLLYMIFTLIRTFSDGYGSRYSCRCSTTAAVAIEPEFPARDSRVLLKLSDDRVCSMSTSCHSDSRRVRYVVTACSEKQYPLDLQRLCSNDQCKLYASLTLEPSPITVNHSSCCLRSPYAHYPSYKHPSAVSKLLGDFNEPFGSQMLCPHDIVMHTTQSTGTLSQVCS